ncbi:8-oxo-dGTP diphosphatase [Candidatus Bathyarchaeota archaeon]|nr:8-oxo-dGTP diphosphatase [Candidatus Bathyarchaeota archaeon]
MAIEATLCEIISGGRLLLLRKAAGRFGEGKWNGAGGKTKPGETPMECVVREIREETGLTVTDPSMRGVLDFYFGEKDEPDWVVHVFLATSFVGELTEGDEGELRWFTVDEIPYEEMWQDDVHWLPPFLDGKRFRGVFWYSADGSELLRHRLTVE